MEEKKKIRKSVQLNRKARHDYELLDQFNAGIELFGTEIKSIRKGNANLRDSYILVRSGEVFWIGGYIAPYEQGNRNNHDPDRTRKLLLKKYEIRKLDRAIKEKGLTVVPIEIFIIGSYAKIKISLAKGKKTYDKRESIKKRDLDREMRRQKF